MPVATWRLVPGHARCERCGVFVAAAWKFFPRPGLWTHCVCEPCAEKQEERA